MWNNTLLFNFLQGCEMVRSGDWLVELIEGSEDSILVTVAKSGDLEIHISVSGDQILASVLLWPVSVVDAQAELNAALLRDHKLLPLSTFGITQAVDDEWYELFGALSAGSTEESVLAELLALSDNAIEVAEVYQDYLN